MSRPRRRHLRGGPVLKRAFRGDKALQDWETDDNTFYGYPASRAAADRMTALVDRVLRAGPFHGKDWPGRVS